MKHVLILIIITLITTLSLSAQEAVYRVSFNAGPLIKVKNGREIPGEAQVGVRLIGKNGEEIVGGKVVQGALASITIDEEEDMKVVGVEVVLNGTNWDKSVKLTDVIVKKTVETEDDEIFKKYVFPCGCQLTQGNESVYITPMGAQDFEEDEAVIAAEEMDDFELDGEYSSADVTSSKGFTISTRQRRTENKVSGTKKETEVVNGKTRICTTKKVVASASFDKSFLTNPTTQAIFPGALIYAESLANGKYDNIRVEQAPIKISTDIAILEGDPVREVRTPSLSSVRKALNSMLVHNTRGQATTSANYKIYEVDTKEELSLELGGHFENASVDIDAQFNYKSNTENSLKVIQFAQIYYTVDIDQPLTPESMFSNPKDAEDVLASGQTPLFVSSVTYGTIAYFFLRTSLSEMEINATLDAMLSNGANTVEINAALDLLKSRSESEMQALIVGGNPRDGVPIGYEDFLDMIRNGSELSDQSLAAPVSYTLRFLSDNSVARVNLTTDYVKRTCKEVNDPMQNLSFTVHSITGDQDMNIHGSFQISVEESSDIKARWLRIPGLNFFSYHDPAHLKKDEAYEINKSKVYGKIDTRKFDDLYVGIRFYVKENDPYVFQTDGENSSYNTIKLNKLVSLEGGQSANPGDPTSTGVGLQSMNVTVDGIKYTIKYSLTFD